MNDEYRICNRCVVDTTSSAIEFDDAGICNYCKGYYDSVKKLLVNEEEREKKISELVGKIKKDGENKKYDCIVGVSGGVDSTYTAYIVKKLGLRPLAVHLDNGWNSELAVSNIEKTLNTLGIDLYTYVLDWEEFKDLQLSFLKASTPDSEIPTDHAIVAVLYKIAAQHNLRYIIRGSNVVTEGILPKDWSHGHADWRYIKNIQKRFGTKKLRDFPHFSPSSLFYYKFIKKIKPFFILNYIDYNKEEAMRVLQDDLGWVYYGGKHYESIYTRFFQGYILPRKFNYDKRKAHLSTLICSGQLTREKALEELAKDPYPTEEMKNEDRDYVIKKIGITEDQFEEIMNLPKKSFWDYPSYEKNWFWRILIKLYKRSSKTGFKGFF